MKRKLIKALIFTATIFILTTLMVFSVSAKTVTKGKFIYEIKKNTATLVEYKGKEKEVKIPSKVGKYKVTAIGAEAFWGKTKMKSVTIPKTVKTIGQAAFNECTSLTKVTFPSSVKKISAGAFWYCTKLETAVIPESVTSIGKNAFKGCDKLTAYVIKGSYGEKYIKKQDNVTLGYRYMTSLSLSSKSLTLTTGSTTTLKKTLKPSVLYNSKVTFTSSNPDIVSVSSSGKLTAKACGAATITCKAKDGSGKKATCTVKVVPAKVTSVKVSANNATGYTLSWAKANGATAYRISRYNSQKKEWQIVTNTTALNCKITGRALGSSEQYTVTPYALVGKTYYLASASPSVTASTLKPAQVTGVKLISDVTSLTVTWNKANGATGYNVYLYDNAKKTYTLKISTTALSAKITGLKANTSYTVAVRSFIKSGSNTLNATNYSANVSAYTLPDTVKNLRTDPSLVYSDSITLLWNKLSGVNGYRIYIYNTAANSYVFKQSVTGDSVTSLKVSSLKPGTVYRFKIKAYRQNGSVITEGNFSNEASATTLVKPTSNTDAYQKFISAFNETKGSADSFFMKKDFGTKNLVAPDSSEYEDILESICGTEKRNYSFENGIDTSTSQAVTSIIAPFGKNCTLDYEQIKTDSISFNDDGSGYTVSFALNQEDENATVNSLIAGVIDFNKIKAENEGFALIGCSYDGTTVDSKITNGKLSWLEINIPVSIHFSLNEEEYHISLTLTQEYYFVW